MKLDGSDFNAGTGGQSIALIPRVGGATASPSTAGEANPLSLIARMGRKLNQQMLTPLDVGLSSTLFLLNC